MNDDAYQFLTTQRSRSHRVIIASCLIWVAGLLALLPASVHADRDRIHVSYSMSDNLSSGSYMQYHGQMRYVPSVTIDGTVISLWFSLDAWKDGKVAWTREVPDNARLIENQGVARDVKLYEADEDAGSAAISCWNVDGDLLWRTEVPELLREYYHDIASFRDGGLLLLTAAGALIPLDASGNLHEKGSLAVDPQLTRQIDSDRVATVIDGRLIVMDSALQQIAAYEAPDGPLHGFTYTGNMFLACNDDGHYFVLDDGLALMFSFTDSKATPNKMELARLAGCYAVVLGSDGSHSNYNVLLILDETGSVILRRENVWPGSNSSIRDKQLAMRSEADNDDDRTADWKSRLVVKQDGSRFLFLCAGRLTCLDMNGKLLWEIDPPASLFDIQSLGAANSGETELLLCPKSDSRLISLNWDGTINYSDYLYSHREYLVEDQVQMWRSGEGRISIAVSDIVASIIPYPDDGSVAMQVVDGRPLAHNFVRESSSAVSARFVPVGQSAVLECCRHRIYDLHGAVIHDVLLPIRTEPWASKQDSMKTEMPGNMRMLLADPGWNDQHGKAMLSSLSGLKTISRWQGAQEDEQFLQIEVSFD
jgi:outer membrane protein assembly factor BamB